MPLDQWWDTIVGDTPNLEAALVGKTLKFGDPEIGQEELTVEIADILDVTVGLDSRGIFCSINILTACGKEFDLYADGEIHDVAGMTAGTHDLKWATVKAVI